MVSTGTCVTMQVCLTAFNLQSEHNEASIVTMAQSLWHHINASVPYEPIVPTTAAAAAC